MKYRVTYLSGQLELESAMPSEHLARELVSEAAGAAEVTRVELKTVTLAGRDGIAFEWVTVWEAKTGAPKPPSERDLAFMLAA